MMRALWEMGCKENADCHQVAGNGASCQVLGPVFQVRLVQSQVRVVESQIWVIERAEKRSTP